MDTVILTYRIGLASKYPPREDTHTYIRLLAEDTRKGEHEAKLTAIAMAMGSVPNVMPTSATLVEAEI